MYSARLISPAEYICSRVLRSYLQPDAASAEIQVYRRAPAVTYMATGHATSSASTDDESSLQHVGEYRDAFGLKTNV
jgi:hypothetical protein